MASPTRFTSGVTQAARYQPLGELGVPDPFFYCDFADDFAPYNAALYTVTAASGTIAATAANGSGGRILFTTGATAGNFCEIQQPTANFQNVNQKKLSFLTRIQVANVTTSAFIVGLIGTSATPFTSIADGIYVSKVAASTNLVLTAVTGSTVVGTATYSGALTNATDIDIAILVDRNNNIKVWAANNLEGVKRSNTANLGPNFGIAGAALTGALTSVLLNPTIAISNGATAAAMTGVADFLFAGQER